jgi:cell division protein FtsZ
MFEVMDAYSKSAVIKVIGIGGGGGNAVQHMVGANIEGVEFICANTDAQALRASTVKTVLQLGGDITRGLGAGANPEVGRQAALEDRDRISDLLEGADMVFITAGMGGGTGTGAAPIVAEIAREKGILTVAVVTRPFSFEGPKRAQCAAHGIRELSQHVDSLITVPNEKLVAVLGRDISVLNAFKAANDVLLGAVAGIAELITSPGLINVDFADVRTVMTEMGMAMMGSGRGRGPSRATEAANAAISSPLLEDINLSGAKGILVNITAGADLTLGEFEDVGNIVRSFSSENATVVVGTVIDPSSDGEVRVTVVATGISGDAMRAKQDTPRVVETPPAAEIREVPTVTPPIVVVAPTIAANPEAVAAGQPENQYKGLDVPPFLRNKPERRDSIGNSGQPRSGPDYLDIPAFLRRQAD